MNRTPWVTYSLAVIFALVHVVLNLYAFDKHFPIEDVYIQWGYVPSVREPITIFTHLFLHGGWFHLLGNIWFLLLFGRLVEDRLGPILFLLVFFASAVGSVALQDYFTIGLFAEHIPMGRNMPLIGASGAIFGLMGAVAVVAIWAEFRFVYFYWFIYYIGGGSVKLVAHFVCAYYIFWNVVDGLLTNWISGQVGFSIGGVAFWAHVGGFAVGLALTFLLRMFAGRFLPVNPEQIDSLDSIRPKRSVGFRFRREKLPISDQQRAAENLLKLLHRGKDEKLVETFVDSVTEFPNITLPAPQMCELAEIVEQSDQRDYALVAWRKVLEVNPRPLERQRALIQLGRLCSDRPHLHAEGIDHLKTLLSIHPDPPVRRDAERLLMKMGAPQETAKREEPESDLTRRLEAQAQGIKRPAYIPSAAPVEAPLEEPVVERPRPFAPPPVLRKFGPAYIPDEDPRTRIEQPTHAVILIGHMKIDVPRVSQIIARATNRSMVSVSQQVAAGMGVVHETNSMALALDIANRLRATRLEAASVELSRLPAWNTADIYRGVIDENEIQWTVSGGGPDSAPLQDVMAIAHAHIKGEIVADVLLRSRSMRLRAFDKHFDHATPGQSQSLISFVHLLAKRTGHAKRDVALHRSLVTQQSACLRFESIAQFETYQRWLALCAIAES